MTADDKKTSDSSSGEVSRRKRTELDKLWAEFDLRLADLQKPDSRKRLAGALRPRGRVMKKSPAGSTY